MDDKSPKHVEQKSKSYKPVMYDSIYINYKGKQN